MVKTINGFELEAISDTVGAIKSQPDIAKFEFRINNEWITAGHNRSYIKDFYGGGKEDDSRSKQFVFDNGEPPILLGNNEGANPVEFVLHALAGCMTTTLALHAAANGIALEKISSRIEGDLDVQGFLDLDPEVRNGYQRIRVNFDVEGDLTAEDRARLSDFCHKSPVFDIITNKVPVSLELS
nr:OsmC family protein [Allomuricauda sp.]